MTEAKNFSPKKKSWKGNEMVLFKKFVARSKENFEESLHALTIKPKVNKGKSSERLGRYQRNRFVIAWIREL